MHKSPTIKKTPSTFRKNIWFCYFHIFFLCKQSMHSVSNLMCEGLLLKTINRIMASLNNTIAVNQMGLWWTAVAKRKLSLRIWVHSSFCKVYLDSFFLKIRYRRITSWIHKTLTNGTNTRKDEVLPAQTVCLKVMQIHTRPPRLICFCVLCVALYLYSQQPEVCYASSV